jgi:hypothetical protein
LYFTRNENLLIAISLFEILSTEIGAKTAPLGTITERLVALALVTTAFVVPKNTTLFESTRLKLVPIIVTVAPTVSFVGLNEVMVGACAKAAFPNTNKVITISR